MENLEFFSQDTNLSNIPHICTNGKIENSQIRGCDIYKIIWNSRYITLLKLMQILPVPEEMANPVPTLKVLIFI